ncbi:MAG TPA: metalloregulator ArsR/SmtB family transcription factor [Cyclobacteriaceae bacterium]|nr:metalloregulator ArsR/SmtB family transcription factor [Cyclobacteriaceae bacterium]
MRLKNFNLALGSQIFKACADESRLRILNLIFENGEMCISDLERILEFTQAKTSRHLSYLKNSGMLTYRRYNHWVFYQVKDEVYEIVNQLLQFIRKDQQLQKDLGLYKTLYSNRELSVNRVEREEWQSRTVKQNELLQRKGS